MVILPSSTSLKSLATSARMLFLYWSIFVLSRSTPAPVASYFATATANESNVDRTPMGPPSCDEKRPCRQTLDYGRRQILPSSETACKRFSILHKEKTWWVLKTPPTLRPH